MMLRAVELPVSPFVIRYGADDGAALTVLEVLRSYSPGSRPLSPGPGPAPESLEADTPLDSVLWRFAEDVLRELHGAHAPLEVIRDVFGLSWTQTGELFGVSRQAIAQWNEQGVPPGRQEKVAAMLALAVLLAAKLRPGAVPGVVRTPAPAYGDMTLLEALAADRQHEMLDITRRSFDWSAAA